MLSLGHLRKGLICIICSAVVFTAFKVQSWSDRPGSFEKRVAKIDLKYIVDIPLAGGSSRFASQASDAIRQRLYISHLGSNVVTVVDLNLRKVLANLHDIPEPTGILAVPKLERLYVSAFSKNKVYVIDAAALKVITRVPTGRFPNGIAFDPRSKRIFVSNEFGQSISVISTLTNRLVGNVRICGGPGNVCYDSVSRLIYSTIPTCGELVGINPRTLKVVERHSLTSCRGPDGLYIDALTHNAFITGKQNTSCVAFDLTGKKIVAGGTVPIAPDILAFDCYTYRLYLSSERGVVAVFDIQKKGIRKIAETFFAANAHTVSIDSKNQLLFFPLQNIAGRPVLRIMEELR